MTIIYNRNTPDYYLVAGLEKESISDRTYGHKTRNLSGDFIVISSDHKVNTVMSSLYSKTWKTLKKTLLLFTIMSMIAFSILLVTIYMPA